LLGKKRIVVLLFNDSIGEIVNTCSLKMMDIREYFVDVIDVSGVELSYNV